MFDWFFKERKFLHRLYDVPIHAGNISTAKTYSPSVSSASTDPSIKTIWRAGASFRRKMGVLHWLRDSCWRRAVSKSEQSTLWESGRNLSLKRMCLRETFQPLVRQTYQGDLLIIQCKWKLAPHRWGRPILFLTLRKRIYRNIQQSGSGSFVCWYS